MQIKTDYSYTYINNTIFFFKPNIYWINHSGSVGNSITSPCHTIHSSSTWYIFRLVTAKYSYICRVDSSQIWWFTKDLGKHFLYFAFNRKCFWCTLSNLLSDAKCQLTNIIYMSWCITNCHLLKDHWMS